MIQLTSQADGDLGGAADVNTSVSSRAAAGQGDVSLFSGDPLLGSAETDTGGVGNFTAVTLAEATSTFLVLPGDNDLGDAADVNTSVSSGGAAGQGDVNLFGGDPPFGLAVADAGGIGNFTAVTLADDTFTFLVSLGDIDLGDGATDVNTSAANGTAAAPSDVSLFDGDSFLGSGETDRHRRWGFHDRHIGEQRLQLRDVGNGLVGQHRRGISAPSL